ncbi:MAG: DNA repair protein RecO, partial [Parcubacteria group bacterium CG_4_10_14_0_2_um_filter_41_6]
TRELGKVTVRARGVRKCQSRRAASLDLFNLLSINLYQKGDFFTLTESKLLYEFPILKSSLYKISLSFQVFELLDKMLAEEQEQASLFDKTTLLLYQIEKAFDGEQEKVSEFKRTVLDELGFGNIEQISALELDAYIESILEKRLNSLLFLTGLN